MSLFTTFAQEVSGSVDVVDSNMVSFKGSISKGKRTGEGIMRFRCGTIYDGGHENDKFHGQATITLPNGETYEAEYKEGWLLSDRMSTYTFSDGSVLKGYPAGKTMYDRIVCLPDILRERRTRLSIQSEKAAASAAACETYSVELDQKDEYHDYWRFRKEMETPYDKAERERVSGKNAEPDDEVAAAHIVQVPKKCVNCNVQEDEECKVSDSTTCVECNKVLTPDYFVCGICNKNYCFTKLCSDKHQASYPCSVKTYEDE